MNDIHFTDKHNETIKLVDASLSPLSKYGVEKLIYIEMFKDKNKALVISNVQGVVEIFHTLGKFSDDFYASIQKASLTRVFLWPANPQDPVGLSLKSLGLSNGMTIIQKHANSIKTWAYIGDDHNTNISDLFANERGLFYDFIPSFQKDVLNRKTQDERCYIPFQCDKTIVDIPNIDQTYPLIVDGKNIRYYLCGDYCNVYITNKEKLCMTLLAQGKTYKEIARDMAISSNTVKRHIDAVKLKTGILRKSDLIQTLITMGIVASE